MVSRPSKLPLLCLRLNKIPCTQVAPEPSKIDPPYLSPPFTSAASSSALLVQHIYVHRYRALLQKSPKNPVKHERSSSQASFPTKPITMFLHRRTQLCLVYFILSCPNIKVTHPVFPHIMNILQTTKTAHIKTSYPPTFLNVLNNGSFRSRPNGRSKTPGQKRKTFPKNPVFSFTRPTTPHPPRAIQSV